MEPFMLNELKSRRLVWLANEQVRGTSTVPTGYMAYDQYYEGIPKQGLIEIRSDLGIGELHFIINYIKSKQQDASVFVVNPPGILTSEYLLQQQVDIDDLFVIRCNDRKDILWSIEQCLKSNVCSTVLTWGAQLSFTEVRRLNLACEQGYASLVIFQSRQSNPILGSKLSIELTAHNSAVKIKVLKQKGRPASIDPILQLNHRCNSLTQAVHSIPKPQMTTFKGFI